MGPGRPGPRRDQGEVWFSSFLLLFFLQGPSMRVDLPAACDGLGGGETYIAWVSSAREVDKVPIM